MFGRIFTAILVGLALTACGYSPFAVRPETFKGFAPGATVEARLLTDDEWDSGGRDDLLAVHVTVRNPGKQPLDVEPWDFVLSSTKVETHPLPPLRAGILSSWHHPEHAIDAYGLLRFTLYLLYLPLEKLMLSLESGPNAQRLDDFTRKALQPASLAPGETAEGVLFYEETLSPRVELGWTVWLPDGSPIHGPELLLTEAEKR